ncbi:procathepsin L [Amyelois transitella]|uniref:procathepsin L n=1 Tax=Amyelois transitella TaxID=680683 RepID=UPI00299026E2|nr:procathepsin L [Amyelois transitella]
MTVGHLKHIFIAYNLTVLKRNLYVEDGNATRHTEDTIEDGLQHLKPYIPQDVEIAFNRYKVYHKKAYDTDEHEIRQDIFETNWRRVASHNRKNLGYKLELNQYADWSELELKALRGALPSKVNDPGTHPFPHNVEEIDRLVEGIPEEYDLRMEGDLPVIKNQLACGSCWAFATVATVEAAVIRKLGGVQLDLSEQSMVDCAWPYGLMGCNGGFVDKAYKYVKEHGIPTEAEYGGYLHEDGYCHTRNMSIMHQIQGYTLVTPRSVNALKYAVYTYGPVEVTIHASDVMILYSSGVFYDVSCEGQRLNHAVVVVGYGSRDGEPYWIVRNSWGETWGEDGYVLMSARDNNCLLLDSPYYPVV